MPRGRVIPPEQLQAAVRASISVAGVIRSLGLAIVGSNYALVKREVARLNLDTSHWKGQGHGTTIPGNRLDPKDVFVENSPFSTGRAKIIILRKGLLPYVCAECGMGPVWNGRPLVLRLDHKNGRRSDHRLSNLRFVCPNCDAQSDTFCGRNKKRCIS